MPENYKRPLKEIAIRTILPSLLGALGALAATAWPAYHTAFCAGGL